MKSALFNFFTRKKQVVKPADILPVSIGNKDHQRFLYKNAAYSVWIYPEKENLYYITKQNQPMDLVEGKNCSDALLKFLNKENVNHAET